MKIIKYALITGLAVYMLPDPPPDDARFMAAYKDQGGQVSSFEMMSAASAAYGDLSGFCSRQQQVCNVAGHVLTKLKIRASYGFNQLYEWVNRPQNSSSDPVGKPQPTPVADMLITGSTPYEEKPYIPEPSIGTLRIEDLIPEWRGPVRKGAG